MPLPCPYDPPSTPSPTNRYRSCIAFLTDYGMSPLMVVSLVPDVPEEFYVSEWQEGIVPVQPFIFYRWLFVFMAAANVSMELIISRDYNIIKMGTKFFIPLHNWVCLLVLIYGVWCALLVHARWKEVLQDTATLVSRPNQIKIVWLMQTSSYSLSFYSSVARSLTSRSETLGGVLHATLPLICLLDLAIVASPMRFFHVYCPALIVLIYVFFTAFFPTAYDVGYATVGGIPLNSWRNRAVWLVLGNASFILIHSGMYALYLCRRRLSRYHAEPPVLYSQEDSLGGKMDDDDLQSESTLSLPFPSLSTIHLRSAMQMKQ